MKTNLEPVPTSGATRHLYIDGQWVATMRFEIDQASQPHIKPLSIIEYVMGNLAAAIDRTGSELDLFDTEDIPQLH